MTAAPTTEKAGSARRGVVPPSLWLTLAEGARFGVELGSFFYAWPSLVDLPRGDGHPVLILPGFVAADFSTLLLRRVLKELGYDVHAWKLGTNTGRAYLKPMLLTRLNEIVKRNDRPISLIGHSLGGVFARELAFSFPSHVKQVITLGSPIRIKEGEGTSEVVRALFERFSRQSPTQLVRAGFARRDDRPPRVPSSAIYTKSDGVVAWQSCVESVSRLTESIQVPGSHVGLTVNPLVIHVIADRLALPHGQWRPFEPQALWRAATDMLAAPWWALARAQ